MSAKLRSPFAALLCACFCAVVLASCGSTKKPIVVGSKAETEQIVLGEIVAQHLEHRLGRPVERRLGLGNTAMLYQSLLSGEIGLYPEYTGLIESEILKEPADRDPQIVLTRVRGEMDRVAQIEVLDSLGFDNPLALVVRANGTEKIRTISDAAHRDGSWKVGVTLEFQTRSDALPALNPYRLSMSALRSMDGQQLFPALEKGDVDMIATRATDGHLLSGDWKVLDDDQQAFRSYLACLMVRKDVLVAEPTLRAALAELSGKLSVAAMRKMNADVDLNHRPAATVATEFLTQAGLK